MSKCSKTFILSFGELLMNTEYNAAISSVYNSFGESADFEISFITGGLPLRAENIRMVNSSGNPISAPENDGAGFELTMTNEYGTQTDAVVMLVLYDINNMIKSLEIKTVTLPPLSSERASIYLSYDEPQQGERLALMAWNSFDFETGVHPLFETNDTVGYVF